MFVERVLWCGVVLEPDNCFALFYFVINACISHVIIMLIRYFLIKKSRDLVSRNPGISGLKNCPESPDPRIAIPIPVCTFKLGIFNVISGIFAQDRGNLRK